MRRRRAVLWPLVGTATILGLLVIGVFPTRTFLAQRGDLSDTAERLSVLREQNELLAARVDDLSTDAEIERIAREQYNFVRPGEEAYAILPAPEPPVQVPDAWPFTGLHAKLAQHAAASG